ncbi:threonylcarbamoyladenosine tRNA methylthiotransferase [Grus japonensis]|uniref:Threonylcarbamoyladenosine tRNA methylthiotransferase n=1 Tax=Grus japonensis TaxID=30415 RepID=A0ABC9WF47_GRUJA
MERSALLSALCCLQKKQRTKDLSQLFHSYNPYDHKVLVPKDPLLMGKMVEVNIYEAGKHFMKGQPVSDARVYTASITRPLAKGEVSGLTEERPYGQMVQERNGEK